MYVENIERLVKSMNLKPEKNYGEHNINKVAPLLPFETREPERPKFKRKVSGVTGELVRLINNKNLAKDFNLESNIDDIVSKVQCSEEEDRKYLKELIKDNLIDKDGNINIFHPRLLNYIQLTQGNESKGEKKIAKFLYDLFFLNNNYDMKLVFEDEERNDVITKLILHKLEGLEDIKDKDSKENKYSNKLEFISDIAREDFKFLSEHKEFFLKNFQSLLSYYYFYYITQLCIKLNKKENADFTQPEELYYLLDWEKCSRNRRSVIKGYKYIKSEGKDLLININIIEHLNFLFNVTGYSLKEIVDLFKNSSEDEQRSYLETIREWIYVYKANFAQEPVELELEFNSLIEELEKSIKRKMDQAPIGRYFKSIEEIGKVYFLKSRGGAYGYMLNLTQEMLLILTAVCIKENKITLNNLYKEYEKRGIYLDSYSKPLVEELLGKLNLIDKKSDSGDAQYVKSIL